MRNFLMTMALVVLAAGQAAATADGPDFWRVTGVAANDVLNMRAAPTARAEKIGEIPHDADGLTNLDCIGGMSFAEFQEATEAEREAARKARWCLVLYKDHVGWVAGRFLTEGGESDRPGSRMLFEYAGSEWTLVALAGREVTAEVIVGFANANQVSGSSGCNRFTGTYVQRGADILIGDVAGTRMMCPDDVMATETAVLGILGRVRTIAGGQFTMAFLDGDGALLATFRRSDGD